MDNMCCVKFDVNMLYLVVLAALINTVCCVTSVTVATVSPWHMSEGATLTCEYDTPLSNTTALTWTFLVQGSTSPAVTIYNDDGATPADPIFDATLYTSSTTGQVHTLGILTVLPTDAGTYTCTVTDSQDATSENDVAVVTIVDYSDTPVSLVVTPDGGTAQTFDAHVTCPDADVHDINTWAPDVYVATCTKVDSYPAVTLEWTIVDHSGTVMSTEAAPVQTPNAAGLITTVISITLNATELDSSFTLSCVPTHDLAVNDSACAVFFAEDPGACSPDPCLNDGVCSKDGDSFSCACAPDWSGNTCTTQVDSCDPNPCLNDGNCTDGIGVYTCDCDPCYTGDSCENKTQNFCASRPCENDGVCTDTCDGAVCECDFGFSGDTCENACNNIHNVSSSNVTVELGQPIMINCAVVPPPTPDTTVNVKWVNEDGDTISTSAQLSIPRASPDNAGNVYCHATIDNCTDREMAVIAVNYDYNSTDPIRETKDVMEGEDVTLKCSADGVPTPSLRWDFVQTESSSSNSSSGVTVQPSESRGNASERVNDLTITGATIEDNGVYTCVAVFASILEFEIKIVTLNVEEDSGGLKGWHIALIVVGCVLFILIVIIIIVVICWKCCDDCHPAICPAEKGDIDEDVEKRPYERSPKKSADPYYNEDKAYESHNTPDRRLPSPPPGTRGGQLAPLEKPKKKKKKRKPQTDEEYE